MPRARNIKPGFFKNEDLAELPADVRLLFIGLWLLCDREGRLEDRHRRIKGEIFPFESFDIDPMLNQLQTTKFIVRYEISGARYMEITNFVKHQDPHYKEKASVIPPPPGAANLIEATGITRETRARIMERDGYRCRSCAFEDYLSIDHILPTSRGGNGEDSNLQVLCLKCNRAKGNKLPGEGKGARRSLHSDTSLKTRPKLEASLNQCRADDPGSIPLNPDSLNPDSLNPDSPEAKASAPPMPAAPLSAKDQLWAIGVPLLGEDKRPAIGRLVRTYGEEAVVEVLAQATLDRPIDPLAWITAALQSSKARGKIKATKENGKYPEYATTQDLLDREPRPEWVVRAGFEDIFAAESAGCGPGNANKFRAGQRVVA